MINNNFLICHCFKMNFSFRSHVFILLEGEATGRLLRYDPTTKSTSVVVTGLTFANGVQISKDETFLLVAETTKCRYIIQQGNTVIVSN